MLKLLTLTKNYEPNLLNKIISIVRFKPKDRNELRKAIIIWAENKEYAKKKYGDIAVWDVTNVTNMRKMFICGHCSYFGCKEDQKYEYSFDDDDYYGDYSDVEDEYNEKVYEIGYLETSDDEDEDEDEEFQLSDSEDNYEPISTIIDEEKAKELYGNLDTNSDEYMEKYEYVLKMGNCFMRKFDGDISRWDMSNVTDMSYMFRFSKFSGDISRWDTSNVETMRGMFYEAYAFKSDISKWDITNMKDMSYMFSKSNYDGNISNWDMSNVEIMRGMFENSFGCIDVSKWNVSNVKDMSFIFDDSYIECSLSDWNMSNVKDMSYMFSSTGLPDDFDISRWDTSSVMDMNSMFSSSEFNGDISKWNTSKVRCMRRLFRESSFNNDISNWDTSSVLDMDFMFMSSIFNGDISRWNLSNTFTMNSMFLGAKFNGDISKWDVSNANDMCNMFCSEYRHNIGDPGTQFNGDITEWNIKKAYNSGFDENGNSYYDFEMFDKDSKMEEKNKPKLLLGLDNKHPIG